MLIPPQIAALYLPPFIPPASFSIEYSSVMPSSSSYTPGLFTWPLIPYSLGPGDFSLPIDLNHCGPLSRPMMCGTHASVSTLLITVGRAKAPAIAGNGGLLRGQPRLPSSASSNPVSSPQIYAPAPR
ncbi:hypothetical protein BH09PLA1_BH09PLA1_10570 [soil metagenome]